MDLTRIKREAGVRLLLAFLLNHKDLWTTEGAARLAGVNSLNTFRAARDELVSLGVAEAGRIRVALTIRIFLERFSIPAPASITRAPVATESVPAPVPETRPTPPNITDQIARIRRCYGDCFPARPLQDSYIRQWLSLGLPLDEIESTIFTAAEQEDVRAPGAYILAALKKKKVSFVSQEAHGDPDDEPWQPDPAYMRARELLKQGQIKGVRPAWMPSDEDVDRILGGGEQ